MSDMIFEEGYPQENDIVKLTEPFKIELKGVPGETFIRIVIEEGSEGKVIRNYGWFISIAFSGYEVEIYDIETYNIHIEWMNDLLS